MKALIFLFLAIGLQPGCATTNRGKTMQAAIASGAMGVLYGQTRAEFKAQNSVMYGSIAMASAVLVGLYVFDEEKRSEAYRQQALALQMNLDGGGDPLRTGFQNNHQQLEAQGLSTFSESELPTEYQHLIRPGGWKVFEINRWVKKGTNRLILESKLLEFIPPSIQAGGQIEN